MAQIIADRIQETTTSTGTGSLTLAGATTGYRAFSAVMANGDIGHVLTSDGTNWEIGLYTYVSATPAFTRTAILSNSAGTTSAISFAAGSKTVSLIMPAREVGEAFFGQRGLIDGLLLSRPSTTTVTVGAGVARSDDNLTTMYLAAATTKTIQASGAWTAGTGNNGLDTGAIAVSTWYHAYVIENSTTGAVDALFSLSATAPTMPTGYDKKRRIGAIRNSAAAGLLDFRQRGDFFYWKASLQDLNRSTVGVSPGTAFTITTPLGIEVQAIVSLEGTDTASDGRVAILGHTGDSAGYYSAGAGVANAPAMAGMMLPITNTSSQITLVGATATTAASITTHGWIDPRGKDQ